VDEYGNENDMHSGHKPLLPQVLLYKWGNLDT
jgi:hypothetical protein